MATCSPVGINAQLLEHQQRLRKRSCALKFAGQGFTSLEVEVAVAFENKISCCNKGLALFRSG